jgi:hypothetical protein
MFVEGNHKRRRKRRRGRMRKKEKKEGKKKRRELKEGDLNKPNILHPSHLVRTPVSSSKF